MSGTGGILALAAKSLWSRRFTAILTTLAIAVSVLLFLGVETLRKGAREGFERTISGADLIVGARSGPINLLLYSVFRIGDATNNITWASYEALSARPGVAWTIPLSLGDSHRGYRVVGTTSAFFEHYRYAGERTLAFSDGLAFNDVFDAVLGAETARALGYQVGDPIVVAHGLGAVSFSEHGDKPFRVAGVLAPTGTPVDRGVYVTLEGIEAIHLGWNQGAPTPLARAITPERAKSMDLKPKEITAVIVGLTSRTAVFQMQREINAYREEPLLAILPAVALTQLWQVVGVAERALSAVAGFVVVVGLVGVLTSILTSVNERRREMAILRAVGARPGEIFTLIVAEAALLALLGALLGVAMLYGGLALAETAIVERLGVTIGATWPGRFDALVVGGVTLCAAVLGAIPAWRAVRNALADGLSVRL